MFEHIILRRSQDGLPISAGQLAEALLYYQKVHLVIDRATLLKITQQIGAGNILALLRRGDLSAVYCEEGLGTNTQSVGVTQYHSYVAFTFAGSESVGQLKTPHERLQYELERVGIQRREAKRFARGFLDLVPVRKFSGDHFLQGGITHAAKRDLLDLEYAKKAIRRAIAITPGGYEIGEDLKLELINADLGTVVFTNIDFDSINERRGKSVPLLGPLTIAHLLSNLLEARADMALASFYGGDFVTSEVTSSIIQVRYGEILRRANLNADARQQFTEVVLPDSPSLAEVIDSAERPFNDFLQLLDDAKRFKDWLKAVSPDEGLIRSYMREISSKGWIERLPAKSLRYLLTAGLDATSPLAGVIAGLLDNFVVEKLLSGWRPNHFIDGKLSPFVHR